MIHAAAAAVAVAVATAEVLLESFVIAVILSLLCVAAVFVYNVIVAVPSTLAALVVAFVSKEGSIGSGGDDSMSNADVEAETDVIELLDEDELSSDEEDDDCESVEDGSNAEEKVVDVPEITRPRERVAFGNVQVREYRVVLGDHPCCTDGFPLTLDWAYAKAVGYGLDALEQAKANSPPRPDLTPEERMLRIAAVAGVRPEDVQKQERTRRWKVEAEKLASRSVLRVPAAGN